MHAVKLDGVGEDEVPELPMSTRGRWWLGMDTKVCVVEEEGKWAGRGGGLPLVVWFRGACGGGFSRLTTPQHFKVSVGQNVDEDALACLRWRASFTLA